MKKKTRLLIILLTVVSLLMGGYVLWQRELFYERVKEGVVNLLAERLGVEILVEKVEGGLLGDIQLRNVSIRNPDRPREEMIISKVYLKYNLWKIITQREKIFGIRRIELDRPVLHLSRDRDGRWTWSELIDGLFKDREIGHLPQIVIKNGRLGIVDELMGKRLRFNRVSGSIDENFSRLKFRDGEITLARMDEPLQGVSLLLSLDGENLSIENLILGYRQIELSIKGEVPDLKKGRMQLEVVSNIFNLKGLKDFFDKEKIGNYLQRLDIEGQLKFKGEARFAREDFFLNGEVVFTTQTLPPLFARVLYREETLTFSPIRLEGSKIIGDINLREASANLELTASRLDPKIFSVFIGKDIAWPYLVDGGLKIDGPIEDPMIKGRMKFIANDPETRIESFEIDFLKEGEKFQVKSLQFRHLNGTRLSLRGISRRGPRRFYSLNMHGSCYLPIANHYLSSRVSFKGRAKDLFSDPYLTGELKLLELCIDKERLGDFIHQIRYHKSGLKILTPSPASNAHLSGRIDLSPFRLDLEIRPDNLDLKPLLALSGLEGIEGRISGTITLKQEAGRRLLVDGEGLQIKDTNLLGASTGILSFTSSGETVDILNFELSQPDGGSLAILGRLLIGKNPSLDLVANCKTLQIGGSLFGGSLEARGDLNRFRLNGSLNIGNNRASLKIEELKGKLGLVEARVVVHSLSGRVGRIGKLSVGGSYPLSGQGEGVLDLRLKDLDWQEVPWARAYFKDWQGEIKASGQLRGGPTGPNLLVYLGPMPVRVKGEELSEFKGELDYQSRKARIKILPTPHLLVEGEVIPSRSQLNLKAEIKGERLSILTKLLPFSFGGFERRVKGGVMVEGDWKNPLIRGNLNIDPVQESVRETGQIKVKFIVKDNIFSTETLHIQQPAGHLSLDKCRIVLPEGRVEILAELVDFKLAGPRLTSKIGFDGILKRGSITLDGELRSSLLWINRRHKIKNLATRCIYNSNSGVKLLPLEAETTLSGMIDTSKKAKLSIKDVKILQRGERLALFKGSLDLEREAFDLEMIIDNIDLGLLCQHIKVIEDVEGAGSARFHLRGTFARPDLSGEIIAKAERLETLYLVDEVRELDAKIILHNNSLAIERLGARVGESKLKVTSKKISPEEIDFSIQSGGRPLRVNIPEFVKGELKARLHFTGSLDSPNCSGEMEFYDTEFTYPPPKSGKELLQNDFFDRINWNLKMIARKNVKYYNDFVNARAKDGSWVTIKGKGDNRRIGGLAWARPNRGKILFLGTEFVIKEAELRFEENRKPPFIFGTAKAEVGGIDLHLIHNGRLFEAKPLLSAPDSYPPKTEEEIVRLLRFGRDYTDLTEEDSRTLLRIGMLRLANSQLSSTLIYPLERRLSTMLNVDVGIKTEIIKKVFTEEIDTREGEGVSSDNHSPLSDTEVSLGRYIADDLYFNYQARILRSSETAGEDIGVGHGFGFEYQFPEEETIRYEYRPSEGPKEEEHKFMLKKEIQF